MPEQAGVTVALDGFGAEQGFDVLAEGARLAAADGIRLRVFGPAAELSLEGVEGVEVIETSEWVSNQDDPVKAVRSREGASPLAGTITVNVLPRPGVLATSTRPFSSSTRSLARCRPSPRPPNFFEPPRPA